MTFLKTVSLGLTIAAISAATACAGANSSLKSEAAVQGNNYLKPGAAITYSHDLKSNLSPGQAVTFKLVLSERYAAGNMAATVTGEGDINFFSSAPSATFDLSDGPDHEMLISFTANSNGRHYINVEALATDVSGQSQPRIFSIPVQVGSPTAQKPNAAMKTAIDGESIIEMEAQEEIK